MELLCDSSSCAATAARLWLTVLVVGLARFTVADLTTPGAAYKCEEGCHSAFRPVCGRDGQTYSNACLATCQGVQVAASGPCDGETLLHPENKHVVTGDEEGSSSPAFSPGATAFPSRRLTRHQLDAFRHEGFRYAGQMRFTDVMSQQHRTKQQQPAASGGAARDWGLGLDIQRTGSLRVIRVTREGHVYMADLDENVDAVLDTAMKKHKADEKEAVVAAAAATDDATLPEQQQQISAVHTLLQSLHQWREYGARRTGSKHGGAAGGVSKWARHTIITSTSGPADHVLEPTLDVAAATTGFVAQSPCSAASAPGTLSDDSGQQQQGVGISGMQVLGNSQRDAAQDKQRQQDMRRTGEPLVGDSGGSRSEVHRPVRRSLGVFDADDRVDCPRTPTYPFTAVGQINVRDPSGNYVCSGALVGPDVVLTAGHCVFSRQLQAFYKALDFAPSRYRTLDGQVINPFGVVPWSYITLYTGYSSLTTPDPNTQDMAVITLSQRIGTQTGWMGVFEPCSPYAPSRYVALTAGYPSDQASGSCKTTQCVVVQEPCTDGYLYHKCDTASGQSGSPLYMMAMTAGRKMGPYIRGVHNIEWVQEMSDGRMVSYINSAVSITPDHYRSILAWISPSFTFNETSPMGPSLPPTNYMSQLSGSQ